MTRQRMTGMILVVLAVAAVASAQSIHDRVIQRYGLNRLRPQNRDEVTTHIVFAARASNAIDNAGFTVYTLEQVIDDGVNDIFVWSDSFGRQLITEHFIGAGAFTMRPGQSYLGDAGPLWLVLHKHGSEVKFTIK